MITILLADDHTMVRQGLRALLEEETGLSVVGEAKDGPETIALTESLRPDVLVKGADYTREGVVGGDLVESWGGEVRLATFEDGYSTTRTIAKMTGEGA